MYFITSARSRKKKLNHSFTPKGINMYKDLAIQFTSRFCEDSVEYTSDMMMDMGEEYTSFKDAKACLQGAIESYSDACLDDYLHDFCEHVKEMIKKKKVHIREISFSEEGFKDCVYSIVEGD